MATVTKYERPASRTPRDPTSPLTPFSFDIAVVAGDADSGDDIAVFTPPAGARIISAALRQTATLGATVTAQLRQGANALTAATTAGGASGVLQNAALEPANGVEKVNILIGGAAIGGSATLRVFGLMILPNG